MSQHELTSTILFKVYQEKKMKTKVYFDHINI